MVLCEDLIKQEEITGVKDMPKSDTQWKKGQSGNPMGRPKGTKTLKKRENFLNALMNAVEPEWEEIINKQIELALGGEFSAAKLFFDHVLPKQKAYIYEAEKDDDLDLDGLDTIEKREEARAIILEAQLKIQDLCVTTH